VRPRQLTAHPRARELAGYFGASCAGLATDAALLVLLSRACGLPYLVAGSLSFTAGGVVVYCLCTRFVFLRPNRGANPAELLVFVMLGCVGLIVNGLVMALVVELLHASLLLAKACAAACTFLSNYGLRRRLLFSRSTGAVPIATRGFVP